MAKIVRFKCFQCNGLTFNFDLDISKLNREIWRRCWTSVPNVVKIGLSCCTSQTWKQTRPRIRSREIVQSRRRRRRRHRWRRWLLVLWNRRRSPAHSATFHRQTFVKTCTVHTTSLSSGGCDNNSVQPWQVSDHYRVVQKKLGHSAFCRISRKLPKIFTQFFAHIKASVYWICPFKPNLVTLFHTVAPSPPSGETWLVHVRFQSQ